jgi:hypothetical protein
MRRWPRAQPGGAKTLHPGQRPATRVFDVMEVCSPAASHPIKPPTRLVAYQMSQLPQGHYPARVQRDSAHQQHGHQSLLYRGKPTVEH